MCLKAIHTLDRCGLRRLCVLRQYTHWTVWSLTPCSIFCNDSSGDRVQCVHWPSTTQCNCKWHVHSTKDTVQVYSLIQCRYFHLHSTGVFVASLPATSQRYLHRRCASSLMLYRYFPWHCTGVFIDTEQVSSFIPYRSLCCFLTSNITKVSSLIMCVFTDILQASSLTLYRCIHLTVYRYIYTQATSIYTVPTPTQGIQRPKLKPITTV